MRAGIYLRVSTDEQKEHGYSISAQQEKLEAYCLSQDWEIKNIYNDEGYSAKDTNRKALNQMIEDIQQNKIDVVLVYRLDRLTRSVLDLHQLLELFNEHDCKFKSATEPFDTTTATGRMFITLVAALSQWERENLIERVNLAMNKKASLGEWSGGIDPFGYYSENGKLYIKEDEAQIIREIFELATVHGSRKIAQSLNDRGYQFRGKAFEKHNILYILKNPLYIGKLRYNEGQRMYNKPLSEQRIYDGEHEPIVDEDTFWRLSQTTMKHRQDSHYYFSGVLYCARCGSRCFGHQDRGTRKYYRCDGKYHGNCDVPFINENAITSLLLDNLDDYIEQYESRNVIEHENVERDYEKELNELKTVTDRYKQLYINGFIDMEELNNKVGELNDKQKQLEKEMSTNPDPVDEEVLYNFRTLWYEANDHEKKLLVNSVFEKIVVDVDDHIQRNKPHYITHIE